MVGQRRSAEPKRLNLPKCFQNSLPPVNFLEWTAPLWRIQNSASIDYRTYPSGRFRFDAPAGQYAVIYANDTEHGPFGENYADGEGRPIGMEDAKRHLVMMTPSQPLTLVDLRAAETLSALDLDTRICVATEPYPSTYKLCQQWSLRFYQEWSHICGIRYSPRKADWSSSNVVLFAERCVDKLKCTNLGQLEDLEEVVLRAADKYKLAVPFFRPSHVWLSYARAEDEGYWSGLEESGLPF